MIDFHPMEITIVIDVFRAFTTAAYVLEQGPEVYYLTNQCSVIARLAKNYFHSIRIGKPEKDSDLSYTIPNSPTRVIEEKIKGAPVLHRTAAGGSGVLFLKEGTAIFAASFVNADATVIYVKKLNPSRITAIPMGYEGNIPSLEDNLCADYINALIKGEKFSITPYISELKEGPGKYFFGEDQKQYPKEDFDRCLELKRFNFAIIVEVKGDYAMLRASDSVFG